MFKGQTILITGGTGSWGYELVRQLLMQSPKEIRIFSRNESYQFTMKENFDNHPSLTFLIGDIKEKETLVEASQGVDFIFHLAALKHVPVCEHQPLEALKTNVMGTQNVIDAAIENNVRKVVYISTDKAANPSNFYGLTKAMGERLIIHANTLTDKTQFVTIRGGNVLGTAGSVIHVFKRQIEHSGKVCITDMEMTRFFLVIEDAIKLVFKATTESVGGEIFVMKMHSCRIMDIAQVLIDDSGKEDVKVEVLGIRPGEKIHEYLLSEFEATNTIQYDDEYYIILPHVHINNVGQSYKDYKPANIENYISNKNLISQDEVRELLERGGFL
ncbi:UDP-N-acetylglucosamine 4,6-dehydratase [Pontibacillus halophilus JSM 076056 = DSM 19796]|uniref:UDP-N-acetylglucosamine 4,6-dehydratase n=1 Tax=Pontibacillus halophilus JSM 076056 = DSM 19796 TaxID=1385510 RepID=A0A0A5GGR2_9BACI|nr:polysaccharide biosynthesis protein [Pontibacillus halophilus]KGX92426.1 UDP-N-acetylglucosamine 4,6-dehydratase [Pontibacillus halophilus JSM 076056 = DSM 19796]